MLLARFINEPSQSKRASQLMERISEDVTSRLSHLTDVAKKRHKLEQRVCADEAPPGKWRFEAFSHRGSGS